jgi:uncharacterized protein YjbJ (UPF0337 family)
MFLHRGWQFLQGRKPREAPRTRVFSTEPERPLSCPLSRGGSFKKAAVITERRYCMNTDQMQGKWKQWKGAAKERWGKLTDDDLDVVKGRADQLAGRIQERYGIAKEEAQEQADAWMKDMEEQHSTPSSRH